MYPLSYSRKPQPIPHQKNQHNGLSQHNRYPNKNKQTNKNLRCGNRKGLLGRNDQTHHLNTDLPGAGCLVNHHNSTTKSVVGPTNTNAHSHILDQGREKNTHGRLQTLPTSHRTKQTNKNLRCGNRKGLLSRNDQTHIKEDSAPLSPLTERTALKSSPAPPSSSI